MYALILWEGTLGGMGYVHTFYQISQKVCAFWIILIIPNMSDQYSFDECLINSFRSCCLVLPAITTQNFSWILTDKMFGLLIFAHQSIIPLLGHNY